MENNEKTMNDLEKEKIQLEINELKKAWFWKPHNWGIILSSIIAITTVVIWTWPSGLLDTKYENLKLEKNILALDIREFQVKKDSIELKYKSVVDSLNELHSLLRSREITLSKDYKRLEIQSLEKLKTKEEIINYYKSRLDSLTTLIIRNSVINSTVADASYYSGYSIRNPDPNADEIIQSIKSGKAKSVIYNSNDLASFNSSFPIFAKYFSQIESHVKSLANIGNGELPIKFEAKQNINLWAENIRKSEKFDGHQVNYPFDLRCGESNKGNFFLTSANIFWVPSQLPVKSGTDYLPENFLPISIELGIGSNRENLQQKSRHLFVAIDNAGKLWYSKFGSDFKSSKREITMKDLLQILTQWVTDKESWEIINT